MVFSLFAVAQQIGDKVELVEGYERFGDASSGPLQVGDRGVVVEMQRGPNGERWVAACKRESAPCVVLPGLSDLTEYALSVSDALFVCFSVAVDGGTSRKRFCRKDPVS